MLRNTSGKLYSVAGAGAVIVAFYVAHMLFGPIESDESNRTIRLMASQIDGLELTAPATPSWAAFPCLGCYVCGAGDDEHRLYDIGIRRNGRGAVDHVGECWDSGTCETWHPIGCLPLLVAAPDLTNLWRGLAIGMPAADVVAAIREWPEVIELNSVRKAVQVVGCDGQIIAHLPIAGDDVRTLEALLE